MPEARADNAYAGLRQEDMSDELDQAGDPGYSLIDAVSLNPSQRGAGWEAAWENQQGEEGS
jgi:hypothetical protein